jgi:hypothetical protein
MVRVPIATDDDPCVRAAFGDVENPDFLNVLAGSNAARAEDAPAHVMLDHDVAGAFIARPEREGVVRGDGDIVIHDVALEFVLGPCPAPIGQMVAGVALEKEFENGTATGDGLWTIGVHRHPIGRWCSACWEEFRIALDTHQADPAISHGRELGVPTQCRYLDAGATGGIQNAVTGCERNMLAVERQGPHTSAMKGFCVENRPLLCGRQGDVGQGQTCT